MGTSDTPVYSPRFIAAVSVLLRMEGGFVNHPADPGGATNYGISLRFLKAEGKLDANRDGFADYDLDFDGDIDVADIRKLTREHAIALYHRCFWLVVEGDRLPRSIGEALFDQAVNGGVIAARKLLQIAVNACYRTDPPNGLKPLLIDGQIGPMTRGMMDAVINYPPLGPEVLLNEYRRAAADRYRGLVAVDPKLKPFLKGWLRRASLLGYDA